MVEFRDHCREDMKSCATGKHCASHSRKCVICVGGLKAVHTSRPWRDVRSWSAAKLASRPPESSPLLGDVKGESGVTSDAPGEASWMPTQSFRMHKILHTNNLAVTTNATEVR